MSFHPSQIHHFCFHLLLASFFVSELSQDLYVHPHWPLASLPDFLHMDVDHSCALRKLSLKISQHSQASSFQDSFLQDPTRRSLNKQMPALLQPRVLFTPLKILNSMSLIVTCSKAAHPAAAPTLTCSLLHHQSPCSKEPSSIHFRNLMNWLCPVILPFQQISGWF